MSGLVKPKEIDWKDTNVALIGSDLDKNARYAASATEPAWDGVAREVGRWIWRIEKFKVVAWPKQDYGKFFDGDSYILLNTYKKPDSDKLHHDIHFWIGDDSTQDEYGTAAYKTVELDDYVNGVAKTGDPVQHREVQGYESKLFLSYFKQIEIMKGGGDSGFRHVKPTEYEPRLLQLKGSGKNVVIRQVALKRDSLNSGDVFVLDRGLNIIQLNGKESNNFERMKAATTVRGIDDERGGKSVVDVIEEEDTQGAGKVFWDALGGHGPIKTAEEGGSDKKTSGNKRMLRVSDASGELKMTEEKWSRSNLDPNDVFIVDTGYSVIVWIGSGASYQEKANGMNFGIKYLSEYNLNPKTPISRCLEQAENDELAAAFA